jgi:uncharacterized protein YjbJ (UPF0337 family)
MNTLELKGNVKIAKGEVKQRVQSITNDDAQFTVGKADQWIGQIQRRFGSSDNNIASTVNECYHGKK